ncbi:unnamed protein product [Microthlaspi erraticum]|uniref:Uncharacterized protein n=1 Tax=Microthlaspi erraticum TaxID=1685480 RepID=A0A6D2JIW8_9BRAS|nr:unnamed protein product [Microthlaspi erraticum]
MKLGFKTGFGSTAALGRSVGTIGRTIGSWPSRNGRGPDDSRSVGVVEDIGLADEILGRTRGVVPRVGRSVRARYVRRVARPRGVTPGSALWSCGVAWPFGVADRGLKFPGS